MKLHAELGSHLKCHRMQERWAAFDELCSCNFCKEKNLFNSDAQ